jgi:serine/threonine protein kinase
LDYTAQRLKLTDFGFAQILDQYSSEVQSDENAGTLSYNPPEVCILTNFVTGTISTTKCVMLQIECYFSTTVRSAVVLLLIYGKLDARSSPWRREGDRGDISSWTLLEKINPWRIFRL